jgi:hypothetical protein
VSYFACAAVYTAIVDYHNIFNDDNNQMGSILIWPFVTVYLITIFLLEKIEETREEDE